MAVSDSITFNGITFRRYPGSRHPHLRRYFWPSANHRRRGVGALHHEVWKSVNGPVPAGFHVHHADHDPLNNDISNLRCLSPAEHLLEHDSPGRRRKLLDALERARPAAAEWHRSDAGREWHRENARRTGFGGRRAEPVRKSCEHCGAAFDDHTRHQKQRFCSNRCKSAWRRAAGLDDTIRICERCYRPYSANKYEERRFCSGACAAAARKT